MLLSTIPRTGAEIIAALQEVHRESVAYWATFSDAEFFARIGTAWSPAENVRHLSKSIRAVQQGLRLPPFVVKVVFGAPSGPARDYETIRTVYRDRLAQGASAGRFAPAPKPTAADPAAERRRIMRVHEASIADLTARIAKWSESDLDTRALPHPLLGKLSVREMLLFTVYHNTHHVANVQRLRAGGESQH
ncbi:MAG: DinB family protein [Gemmatimonadaceae bacterium]|nr:DinB family protein [Gemmatimonadaceae bacterium]